MGKVKLTLTVDKQVIANAKIIAQKKQQSLSDMVEQLLVSAGASTTQEQATNVPVALALRGIAKGTLSNKTEKQIREMMLKDRYGI